LKFGGFLSILTRGDFSGTARNGYIREGNPLSQKMNVDATYDFSEDIKKFNAGLELGAKFVENNTKAKNGDNFILFFANNRDKTLQLFKNGEIAYKNTALGGCISTEACDSRIARSTTACFDCYGGILKKSKVDNVIQKQKEFMEYLNKDSIEYRTEMDDLNKLEDLRNKLIKD
jgi:hypothetical protein